jgi:hypothetical protein
MPSEGRPPCATSEERPGMRDDARSSAQAAKSTGVTGLVTQNGSVILVDWDLLAYRRSPGTQPRPLTGDETRIFSTRIGSKEIGPRADVERLKRIAARYISSAAVSIGQVPHRWAEQ